MDELSSGSPIRVAIRNDYPVIVAGVAALLEPYNDQVRVVDAADGVTGKGDPVDVTLYDTFGRAEITEPVQALVGDRSAGRVAMFTWNLNPALVRLATQQGVRGYLPKSLDSHELVDAIVRIHRGEVVILDQHAGLAEARGDWPGKEFGLTGREADMVSLVTQGLTNDEIARLCFISINSVKTYIRTAYRKMGVTTRSEAVLWGVRHGLLVGDSPTFETDAD